jgi:Family of unknown function (DUF6152)
MRRIAVMIALVVAAPLFAHHSVKAECDTTALITYKGVVTSLEWLNPHAVIHVDVTDETGKVTAWAFDAAGPGALMRRGWTKSSLKQGDQVTITAYPAKDGSRRGAAGKVMLANGAELLAADSWGFPGLVPMISDEGNPLFRSK